MTHGHLWAASQLGFHVDKTAAGSPLTVSDSLPVERKMPAYAAAYICFYTSKSLITLMDYKSRLFGWDVQRLKEMASPHLAVLVAAGPQQPTNRPAAQ